MNNARNRHLEDESERDILNERQTALFLGVSTKSLRKLRQKNQIPYGLIGGRIVYLRSKLIDWIAAGGTHQPKGNE